MDFVPPTTIGLDPGDTLQRDIRMEVDTLTDAFTVCADCPAEVDTYVPPDSLVAEFQRDREDSWNQPVKGPEPVGGWEFYWSRLPEYPQTLKEAGLEGTVVVEGRIGTDGFANGLRWCLMCTQRSRARPWKPCRPSAGNQVVCEASRSKCRSG